MKVPRPTGGSRQSNGVGKIFVKFDTPESAGKALRTLAGRKFADRTVVTTYFSEASVPAFYLSNIAADFFSTGKL
jgi:splicing factor U2AF subunit